MGGQYVYIYSDCDCAFLLRWQVFSVSIQEEEQFARALPSTEKETNDKNGHQMLTCHCLIVYYREREGS